MTTTVTDKRATDSDDETYGRTRMLTEHDALCLQPGDYTTYGDRVYLVGEVKRKKFRGGGEENVVTLVNGPTFDVTKSDKRPEWMDSITIWRPMMKFRPSGVLVDRK